MTAYGAHAATIDNTYLLLGNLKDSPSLSTGTVNSVTLAPVDYSGQSSGNSFTTDTINVLTSTGGTTSCGTKQVYHVVTNAGLQSAVGAGTDYAQYSITMLAKLDSLSSYKRWMDFSDGTADTGIYALNNDLNFYPAGNVFTNAFAAGKYSLITLTRSTAGIITVYVGAQKVTTYSDTADLYRVPSNGHVIFIRDNKTGSSPNENIGANIAYINVSNFLKTDAQVADTANNICTVSTSSKLTLSKTLADSRLADTEQFTVQIKDSTGTVVNSTTASTTNGAGSTVGGGSGTTGVFTASGGKTYTLTEVGVGTTNISSYLSTISCSNATTGSSTPLPSGQLVGGSSFSITPAILDDIRCTLSNTPRPPVIRLTAALGTARISNVDQFTVGLTNGGNLVSSTANSTSAGTANLMTAGKGTTDFFTATPAQTYTLTESMAASSPSAFAQYAKQLSCSNARTAGTAVGGINALGQSITPVAGDVIDCVVTNSAIPTLVLKQISHLGIGAFSYTGDNGWGQQNINTTSVDGTGTPTAALPLNQANATTNLTASLTTGWRLSALSCVDSNAAVNGNTGTFGTFSSLGISIPAAKILSNSQLVCTVTATLSPTLTLLKLVNGTPARLDATDRFAISLTSNTTAGKATIPSSCAVGSATVVASSSLACTTDTSSSGTSVAAQVASFVLVADGSTTYTLGDAMGAGAVSALSAYKANFSCSVSNVASVTTKGNSGTSLAANAGALPATPISLSPAGSPLVASYTILPGGADQIVCTYENQSNGAHLTLSKVSNGGVDTFGFNGTAANANGFGGTGNYQISTVTPSLAASGSTVGLLQTNTLTEIQEVTKSGWALVYASCTDANASGVGNFGTLLNNVLSIPAAQVQAGADLRCVFTNNYVGYSVSGKVILDDGSGAGLAHNGIQDGSETGNAGVQVRLSNCAGTVYSTATTAGDGSFALSLNSAPVGANLCIQQLLPAGYGLVSVNVGSTGASLDASTASLVFSASANTNYTGVVFGNARASVLTSDNLGQAVAGASQTFAHRFTAGTAGSVSFTLTDSSTNLPTNSVLYLDPACSGTLSANSTVVSTAVAVRAGDSICLLVQRMLPAGLAPNASYTSVLSASLSISLPTLDPSTATQVLRNTDLSTLSAGGVLSLHKEFRTLANCPADAASSLANLAAYGTTGTVRAGQVIEYRVNFQNIAAAPITDIRIHDAVPAYSVLERAYCLSVPTRGLGSCSLDLPASSTSGNTLGWTLADANGGLVGLQPSDGGMVGFCVRVQQ